MARTVHPSRCFGVVGAGCAGMSVAVALRQALPDCRIVVFEAGDQFPIERTWCWWSVHPTPFDADASHAWRRWRVRAGGRDALGGSDRHPYLHLPGERFFESATARLERSGGVDLRFGQPASGVVARPDGADVLVGPQVHRFDAVFDGRPPHRAAWRPGLLQRFVGLEVETDRSCFDPNVVTLMDFDAGGPSPLHFMYVLPFSSTRALVESTVFDRSPGGPDAVPHERMIEGYLNRQFGRPMFTRVRREAGAVPMAVLRRRPPRRGRVVPIGARAGLIRASSGYAFAAIQRDAADLARRAAAGIYGGASPRTRVLEALDALLLTRLRRRPDAGAALLARLAARCPGDRFARFMMDAPTVADIASVVASVRDPGMAAAMLPSRERPAAA